MILLLTDIYMPCMNGFELCQKIVELDVNIRICFNVGSRNKYSGSKRSVSKLKFNIFSVESQLRYNI